jgi:hypothetical protein
MDEKLTNPQQSTESFSSSTYIMVFVFMTLWTVSGIAAFIMSIVCFARSGTMAQQVVGLLLAIFFGPFYWIYYFILSSYCKGPIKSLKRK